MRCLFCKKDSSTSRSVEHIIPESLGNTTHILPKGVVCDQCNNYFSREVEKPFLESPAIRALRFEQALESKKGRVPALPGMILPDVPAIVARFPKYNATSIVVPESEVARVLSLKESTLIFPLRIDAPTSVVISRFMAKVALESMAQRIVQHQDGLEYLCDETQLDLLRDHARRGRPAEWPVHTRRIYDANGQTHGPDGSLRQVVHESDFLVVSTSTPAEPDRITGEWFFVLAVFGLELAINLGGPEIGSYLRWLKENNNESPLYNTGNQPYPKPWPYLARPSSTV